MFHEHDRNSEDKYQENYEIAPHLLCGCVTGAQRQEIFCISNSLSFLLKFISRHEVKLGSEIFPSSNSLPLSVSSYEHNLNGEVFPNAKWRGRGYTSMQLFQVRTPYHSSIFASFKIKSSSKLFQIQILSTSLSFTPSIPDPKVIDSMTDD